MGVAIRVLGGFDVTIDGRTVSAENWSRRQAATLVKLLAITPGHRLHREQVIDALWPELTVEEALPRLHKSAYYVREATGVRESIVNQSSTVMLFPHSELDVDVNRFLHEQAGEALAVYRGDLLPDDPYEPWTEDLRQQLRLRYLALLREHQRWEELVAADPTDEDAHVRLVRRHLDRGDRAQALRQLDHLEACLRRAFDVDPSPAARALREEALALVPDGPAGDARPVAAPLPQPATPTVGRDRDVDRVREALAGSRLVSLLGPGGVGKTRLAVETARRVVDEGTATHFVELTRVREPGLVAHSILSQLGVHLSSEADPAAAVAEAVSGRPVLLVLDNFEHVVDAAPFVAELVSTCAELRILVTSRARLRLRGETIFDVEPLDVDPGPRGTPDAVRLFDQAASAIDPSFELAVHLEDVASICRTLDGLPLAIELAAGQIRTLPPALLRARLRQRLGSPSTATRDAPERQRTIPATIDWSLQLLTPAERRAFVRMGIFDSAVPLAAVDAVVGADDDDVVERLERLIDQSLVRRTPGAGGEPRYGLLELLRERARQLLDDDDEREAIGRRRAEWVGAYLDDLDDRRWHAWADRWIDLIAELLPEIRAAYAWARDHDDVELAARIVADLGTFWHREGHHPEGRQWLAGVWPHLDRLELRLRGRVLLAAGLLTWSLDPPAALEHWDGATEIFAEVGDDRYRAYALGLSAAVFIGDRERYETALERCDAALALAREIGARPLIAQALNIRGELTRVHGDDEAALVAYEEGRTLAIEAGDEAHLTVFLANLAYLADHRGDHVEARRLGADALVRCRAVGRRMTAAWTISEMAAAEVGLGRPERGAVLVGAADEALDLIGGARHPGDLSEHARVMAALDAALGAERTSALRRLGATLSLDQAIDLALSEAPVDAVLPHSSP